MTMFLVIGRSGSGKNYFTDLLNNQGLKRVISRTTRPKRDNESKDDYIWVNDKIAAKQQDRVAQTKIGDVQYYTLKQDLKGKDIYIIDPNGMYDLAKNTPDVDYHIIYVHAPSKKARMEHTINREKDRKQAKREFEKRDKAEDKQFSDFEKIVYSKNPYSKLPMNIEAVHVIENNYENGDELNNWAASLASDQRMRGRLANMIRRAAKLGIIKQSPHGKYEAVMVNPKDKLKNKVTVQLTGDIYADYLLNNLQAFSQFMIELMTHDKSLDKIYPPED